MKKTILLTLPLWLCFSFFLFAGGPVSINLISSTDATCNGINNGSALVAAAGGTAPYAYSWSPSGGSDSLATGLAPGSYTVTVTDAGSNTGTLSVVIGENYPISSVFTPSDFFGYNISCFGGSNGTLVANPSGGVGLADSIQFNYTGAMEIYVVPAGVTEVTIKTWGAQGGANWVNNTNFGGFAQGNLAVSPGETLYVFVGEQPTSGIAGGWNGGGSGDGAGKGGGGASDVRQGGITLNDRKIVGSAGGGAGYWSSLHVVGGIGGGLTGGDGYRNTTADMGGLGATQTAGGADGTCVAFNVTSLAGSFGLGGTPFGFGCGCEGYGGGAGWYGGAGSGNCRGGGGGSSYIGGVTSGSMTGGVNAGHGKVVISYAAVPVYTYLWSDGSTSANINALLAGEYFVTIQTNAGCEHTDSITLTQPAAINVDFTSENVTCNGGNDGTIAAVTTGGIAPYAFLWSPGGSTSPNLTGLEAGVYTLVVTDTAGCTLTDDAVITEPVAMVLTAVVTDESLGNDGAINLTVTNGNAPFSFDWSNGATTEDINGLADGVYSVEVTDSSGCTDTLTVTVNSTMGIESAPNLSANLYPNPATSVFYIDLAQLPENDYTLSVMDITGKTLWVKTGKPTPTNHIVVNTDSWKPGIYIVKIETGGLHVSKRVVIGK